MPSAQPNPCANLNHRRRESPVSHCPDCGHVVNAHLSVRECSDSKHAVARRQRSAYCIDCGTKLVVH